jgi:glycosyltransferase involved in cell wall biosynthesis
MNRAGTETMLMNYYRHIDRTIIQFDFAVSSKELNDYEDEIISLGGRLIRYPRYTGLNHIKYIKWWKEFLSTHEEYQIIHGHIGSTAAIYLGIAKKYGRFTIAHSHGKWGKLSLHQTLYMIYSYRTRFIADYFFGCSMDALLTRYGKKIALNSQRSRVLNNAIELERYSFNESVRKEMRQELGVEENCFVLGTIGRFCKEKNPYFTLQIIEKMKKQGILFKFVWIGIGPMMDSVVNIITKKKLSDCILLLGLRDDIPQLLQAFDAFILPSLSEGLGIVAIESQAAGLPTICSTYVPNEVGITNLVSFIDLDDMDKWINKIIESIGVERANTYNQIYDAKYDINENAMWLSNFYTTIFQKGRFEQ